MERLKYRVRNILFIIVLTLWSVSVALIGMMNSTRITRMSQKQRSWGADVCGYPQPTDYTQPRGCILLSEADKDRPAVPVTNYLNCDTDCKKDYLNCNFFNENFMRAYCGVEAATHDAVRKVVTPEDVVLEVGARYGTTTCAVAAMQNNSGNILAVEPDHVVWAAAEFNKLSHNCAGVSVLGVLGEEDVFMEDYQDYRDMDTEPEPGYNKRTYKDKSGQMVPVKHFTWNELEAKTGMRVNTVILDCEGCWVDLVSTYRDKFRSSVDKIILENDNYNGTVTEAGLAMLESIGFSVNKTVSTGHVDWMGSILVLNKNKDSKD